MKGFETGPDVSVQDQFIEVARQLSGQFPELDLRFNLEDGSPILRFMMPEFTAEVFELELGALETSHLVCEAMFTIKEIARLFDD